jgi:endonuclease/exonuclease/phosphatase family metal-dependent hydrolase
MTKFANEYADEIMYTIKKILKAIIMLIIVLWAGFFGIIIFAILADFKPDGKISIPVEGTASVLNDTTGISLLTWNIGYFGLDEKMDFFYDGGTKVVPPKKEFIENYHAITDFLKRNDSIDFILLQEVDRKSKRSYRMDEYRAIVENLKKVSSQFAANYDVFFVPVPLSEPMGKVFSGISIMADKFPETSERHAFPGQYGFPKQLFMLDRCFLVNHYLLSNGKKLLIINTHNEAFDTGDIRKAQMEYLKGFLIDEYRKGNYIIAGGDWNQSPPDFQAQFDENKVNTKQMALNSDFLPADWKWAYDNTVPSNRSVTAAYNPSITITTVIDYFLLSPNIENISVKCINLNFKNSDHNPVIIKAKLKTGNSRV